MNSEYQCSIQFIFCDLSTALSILASSSVNAWCSCQLLTSFYITRRYNMSDKYHFLCHLVPPKFEHLSENCIRTSKCLKTTNQYLQLLQKERQKEEATPDNSHAARRCPFFVPPDKDSPRVSSVPRVHAQFGQVDTVTLFCFEFCVKIFAVILYCFYPYPIFTCQVW